MGNLPSLTRAHLLLSALTRTKLRLHHRSLLSEMPPVGAPQRPRRRGLPLTNRSNGRESGLAYSRAISYRPALGKSTTYSATPGGVPSYQISETSLRFVYMVL